MVTSISEADLRTQSEDVPAEGPALPAELTSGLGDEGLLGVVTGAGIAAGCEEDHKGSGVLQTRMAST